MVMYAHQILFVAAEMPGVVPEFFPFGMLDLAVMVWLVGTVSKLCPIPVLDKTVVY